MTNICLKLNARNQYVLAYHAAHSINYIRFLLNLLQREENLRKKSRHIIHYKIYFQSIK